MVRSHGFRVVGGSLPLRRRSILPFVRPSAFVLAPAFLLVLAAPAAASQTNGRWLPSTPRDDAYKLHDASTPFPPGLQVATHLAVLRGTGDSTVVLYWHSPTESFVMTHWDQGYPAPPVFGASNRKNVQPPSPLLDLDIFCAGHSSLGDGRLLVTGGTGEGQIGSARAITFDPTAYANTNNGWAGTDAMTHARWYPSQVSLANKTITYSGVRFWEMMMHGGELPSGGTPSDSLVLMGLLAQPFWRERYPHLGDPLTGVAPSARTDHTGNYYREMYSYDSPVERVDERGVVAFYGGRTDAASSTAVNELWIAWRTAFDPEESWNWKQAANVEGDGRPLPPQRHQHSAVVNESWNAQFPPDPLRRDTLALFVYGGLDENGVASDELLLLRAYVGGSAYDFTTTKFAASGRRPALGERLPERFALYPSEPNPAGASTIIRFDLPVESPVKLEVFDLLGRRVATLADRTFPAGTHGVPWNLRDANGAPVRPGVYVYRITAGEFRAKGKMSVVP